MTKVAIIAQGLSNGGAERVASILSNYLANRGYEVLYICAYNNRREYKLNPSIFVKNIDSKYKNKCLKLLDKNLKIKNFLVKNNVDYAFSFITNESVLTSFYIPTIFSLRNDPNNHEKTIIHRILRNIAYSRAKNVVFQTYGAQKLFNKSVRNKSIVIRNPVDIDSLGNWELEKANNTFIAVCRLEPQKNLKMLIDSFSMFISRVKGNYLLEIYGSGSLKDELEKYVVEKKMESKIFLKGHSEDIYKIMEKSFCFVQSSNYEGLSNSMLEALCTGIPCICTDSPPGGAREFINNKINGILVDVEDTKGMANAMETIATDKNLRLTISKNCKKIARELDKNEICILWESLLKK